MKTTTRLAAVTLAALSLVAADAVFAYPGQGPGPVACEGQGMGYGMGGRGMGPGAGMGPGMRGGMHGPETPAVTAARLSDLKAELKIGAAQDGAWQAYTAVVQQQAEQRQALRTQMQAQMQDPQAVTPAERAAHREAMLQQRETHFATLDAALKDLYAVLTPEQKAVADQRLRGPYGQHMTMRGAAR